MNYLSSSVQLIAQQEAFHMIITLIILIDKETTIIIIIIISIITTIFTITIITIIIIIITKETSPVGVASGLSLDDLAELMPDVASRHC